MLESTATTPPMLGTMEPALQLRGAMTTRDFSQLTTNSHSVSKLTYCTDSSSCLVAFFTLKVPLTDHIV